MGQRLPDEDIEYGDDCSYCWDTGKTPEKGYARFFGLQKCTPGGIPPCSYFPHDRVWTLTQHNVYACRWYFYDAPYTIYFRAWYPPISGAFLRADDDNGHGYFLQETSGCYAEGTVLSNYYTSCAFEQCACGGWAVVTWTPQATELLSNINVTKATDLFMELFAKSNGDIVYKFCKRSENTNIKILFSP